MHILSLKPGHDGSIAYLDDGVLLFSMEGEKDSFPRFSGVTAQVLVDALQAAPAVPDIVAIGGWHKTASDLYANIGAGYAGLEPGWFQDTTLFGTQVRMFSSTHERSHIMMATGMHPKAPLRDCTVLVWEGTFGALYEWRDYGANIRRHHVMSDPGAKYSALFGLADPTFGPLRRGIRPEDAGKLMALAGLASSVEVRNEDAQVVDRLLDLHRVFPFQKDVYAGAALHNCGLDNPRLWAAAAYMTGRIFEAFRRTAAQIADAGSPLVISGGCGLNCTWNEQWRRSGLFNDVFVPPCTNDSGSAIGTAIDAQVSAGGDCRIEWSVYAGSEFVEDVIPDPNSWRRSPLDFGQVAQRLHAGEIVAWVQGKSEIGPRALGNRSLLASPLTPDMRDRLNALKGRESYRPIAPCCRIEEHDRWFSMAAPDPHMLFFGTVRTNALPAITHVDGTARVQAVSSSTNAPLHHLLTEFGSQSGYGVLCNTSLNFPGVGFINRLSDLTRYCETRGLTTFVAGANTFTREGDGGAIESGLTTLASNERSLVGGGATNAPPR